MTQEHASSGKQCILAGRSVVDVMWGIHSLRTCMYQLVDLEEGYVGERGGREEGYVDAWSVILRVLTVVCNLVGQ